MLTIVANARGGARQLQAIGTMLAGILLAFCSCADALDPALDVSQYAHTPWRIREGFPKSEINAIAQTPDGYIWFGTDFGLLRFDGVRDVPWQPPPGQNLPSSQIWRLLSSHDGTMWIGTNRGLASWKGSKLNHYAEFDGLYIFSIVEAHDGTLWVSGYGVPSGKLCAIQKESVHCYGADGGLGPGAFDLYEDKEGNLWAGVLNGLWRWWPAPSKFYPMPDQYDSIRGFAEDDNGALLFNTRSGMRRLMNGRIEPYSLPGGAPQFRVNRMLRDRDGGLWLGTSSHGIEHVHRGRTDMFGQSNGLSGDDIMAILEDREGSIWVVTTNGLDRFHEVAVSNASVNQGLPNGGVWSVIADSDGSIWLGTIAGLNRWNNGEVTRFGKRSAGTNDGAKEPNGKLNGDPPNSLFQDGRGRIWASTMHGFGYLDHDRFFPMRGIPGGPVHSIAGDNTGNVWIANQDSGLFRLSSRNDVQQIPWADLGHNGFAYSVIADPSRGGLWLGFFRGGIAHFSNGKIDASYGSADGLTEGIVHTFRIDEEGALWVATEGGLSRLKDGRIATLTSKNGLPCDPVHWMIEDDDHSFWLQTGCGLVRVARREIEAWTAAMDKNGDAKPVIRVTVFDSADGVQTRALPGGFRPLVAKSSDGKVWFADFDGVGILDPRHIPFNNISPPVHIEQISADHKTYAPTGDTNGSVRLPPLIRDLQIDYTALSLVAPNKVLFRYKLEGWDHDWQEAGTRRQAFYSNLPPRNYTFRVKACNNSGVWNEAGASLALSVAPAYYQTTWFRMSCVAAFLLIVAAFYQLRLRHLARMFNIRLDERVAERTRMARDLHDTLLQSFQGVLLKFHAVTYLLDRPAEAGKALESTIDSARHAISEGRDAVQGLRSSTVAANDLARAISLLGDELVSRPPDDHCPDFCVQVEGASRKLAPIVRDEVYRIAGEGMRNAFRHANAGRVEVVIHYGQWHFRLCVRDNGKGIDPKILEAGGRDGHFGLSGMDERARQIGGKMNLWSEIDSGTEAELTIPAAIAYSRSENSRRSGFSRKGA